MLVAPIPENQVPYIDLFQICDSDTGRTRLQLRISGLVLHFYHRGRHAEYDLSAFSGRPAAIVCRWNPTTVSVEVQVHPPNPEPHIAIGLGQQPKFSGEFRDILEGEIVTLGDDRENTPIVDRTLALAFLVKRGTKAEHIKPAMTAVGKELADVVREIAAHGGLDGYTGPIRFAQYALLVEVDDERWHRWKTALGRSVDSGPEVDFAFVRFPLSELLLESVTGTLARAFALRLDQLGDKTPESELIPPVFVDEDDARKWFWAHAALGHVVVDGLALAMKAEIEERLRLSALRAASESTYIDATRLQTLFDCVGRAWLRQKIEKRRKKRTENVPNSEKFTRLLAIADGGNTAIDSFEVFAGDVTLHLVPVGGSLVDLFIAARALSSLLDVVKDRAPELLEAVVQRLRITGREAGSAEFEVQMLALLLSLGHDAAFVPTESQRTPDIVIKRSGGDVFVECARKDAQSEDEQGLEKFARELTRYLDSQARKRRVSYRFDLSFDAPFESEFQRPIFEQLKALVQHDGGEFSDEGSQSNGRLSRLGEWGRVWSFSTLQNLAPAASRIWATGEWQEGWSVRGHLYHATVISLTFQTIRRLTKSIENTLRNKGKMRSKGGQVPDGMSTVCAISLGTVDDATIAEVLKAAPRLLAARSAVSALIILWSKRVAENYVPVAVGWAQRRSEIPKLVVRCRMILGYLMDCYSLPNFARINLKELKSEQRGREQSSRLLCPHPSVARSCETPL